MKNSFNIGSKSLTVFIISDIISRGLTISLSSEARKRINNCNKYLIDKISNYSEPIYGINTGFGSLYNHQIPSEELAQLQKNLVLSHACGVGEQVPQEIVKIMLLLKINSLSLGYSGVQLKTVQRLVDMFNNKFLPVVYQQGSLGASGDLSPLAHLSLPLIGEGEVNVLDVSDSESYVRKKSSLILKKMSWNPIELGPKEGLALLNGTQFMAAYGVWSVIKAKRISYLSDMISSISLEAFNARSDCFDASLHQVRPFVGQIETSKNIRNFLKGSYIQKNKNKEVQDPYSFRCIPQVHGATKDVISHVKNILEIEINSVTDNPTIFFKEDKIISGGNFHGQPLAMAMDYLSIGIAELASISERRIFNLISGKRDLPSFLVSNPGVNSGMMIPQYTAASIVSQNKQLCTPASVDSIVSSNGQEDHVSMGANSATKLYKIIENVEYVLAIEIMNASQALSFRNLKSSSFIESLLDNYRKRVDFLDEDRLLYNDIKESLLFIRSLSTDLDYSSC